MLPLRREFRAYSGGRARLLASALLVVTTLAACTSRTGDSSGPGGDTGNGGVDTSLLGTPNKATGTPIKIGFLNDGKSAQIDNTGAWGTAEAAAKYANEYLGGLNGHVIEMVHCETGYTPAGGTACGAKLKSANVAAVLSGASANDSQVSDALGPATPYLALLSGSIPILLGQNRYLLTNPLAQVGAQIEIAKEKGLKKAASVLIDVPAAAGAAGSISPTYAKAGIKADFILISAKVADHTSRIQQAVNSGDQTFTVNGNQTFFIADLKALRQLKFNGPIIVSFSSAAAAKTVAQAVPGGLTGMINATGTTSDPSDPDVKLYNTVVQKYGAATAGDLPESGFVAVMSLVRAVKGQPAVDAKSISKALSTMKAVDLPLGGGIKLQCGKHALSLIPAACATQYLTSTLDQQGNADSYKLGDIKPFL